MKFERIVPLLLVANLALVSVAAAQPPQNIYESRTDTEASFTTQSIQATIYGSATYSATAGGASVTTKAYTNLTPEASDSGEAYRVYRAGYIKKWDWVGNDPPAEKYLIIRWKYLGYQQASTDNEGASANTDCTFSVSIGYHLNPNSNSLPGTTTGDDRKPARVLNIAGNNSDSVTTSQTTRSLPFADMYGDPVMISADQTDKFLFTYGYVEVLSTAGAIQADFTTAGAQSGDNNALVDAIYVSSTLP